MFKMILLGLTTAVFASSAIAKEALVTIPSAHSSKATLDKFESLAQARGLKIFARIDHAAGAQSIGEKLPPTELLIFGNPKGGTPAMQCAQTFGIDLPLHVLAWEDAAGKSWLGYKNLAKLDHRIKGDACEEAVKRLSGVLESLAGEAAKP